MIWSDTHEAVVCVRGHMGRIRADIAELIGSEASPVGIDAKKIHIIILHKLIDIDCRLARLEGKDAV